MPAGKRRKSHGGGQPHVALLVETSLASGRDIVRGVARYAHEHGPWSTFLEPRSLEADAPHWLANWKGDGIIARLQTRQIAKGVAGTGIPAVDVLGVMPHSRIPLVHVDHNEIACLAAEHLLDRGFRHFGYCGITGVNWSDARQVGFVRRVAAAGHTVGVYDFATEARGQTSWEQQQELIAEWLVGLPKPVGVMACNDPRGQNVLDACRRAGIEVPDQVAVIGVDNDEPICEISDPPLSSVVPNHMAVGYEAAAVLHRLMRGQAPAQKRIFLPPSGIVTRHSTDVLAMENRDVAAAVRFIREKACDGIRVSDVVEFSLLPRRILFNHFQESLGRSIHDEIVRVRIARAKELLAGTDMPLSGVAERSGFRHQEYMGAVLLAHVGQTPAQYRRQARHSPRIVTQGLDREPGS